MANFRGNPFHFRGFIQRCALCLSFVLKCDWLTRGLVPRSSSVASFTTSSPSSLSSSSSSSSSSSFELDRIPSQTRGRSVACHQTNDIPSRWDAFSVSTICSCALTKYTKNIAGLVNQKNRLHDHGPKKKSSHYDPSRRLPTSNFLTVGSERESGDSWVSSSPTCLLLFRSSRPIVRPHWFPWS